MLASPSRRTSGAIIAERLAGQARPVHWFPYGRVGVVNADP